MNSDYNEREMLNLLMRLMARTTPYGTERKLEHLLPKGGKWDKADNYIVEVGTGSTTLFACHLDTVGRDKAKTRVVYYNGMLYSKGRKSPIGADDKAGVLVCTALINANVPGVYVFHAGEECGGIGARYIADSMDMTRFKRAVEFDRRGKESVITKMGWSNTCSEKFAEALCDELGMGFRPDPTGIFTDVSEYADVIPEVTNISVGYCGAHGPNETLDADWLICRLIPRLVKIDWESLPVERNPEDENKWDFGSPMFYGKGSISRSWMDEWECEFCGAVTTNPSRLQEIVMEDGYTYWVCRDCALYLKHDAGYGAVAEDGCPDQAKALELAL